MKRKLIYVFIIIAGFFIPSYTQNPFNPQDTYILIGEVLAKPVIYQFNYLFPVAKLALLFLFLGPVLIKNKFRLFHSIITVVLLTPVVLFQNMSTETSFGFAVLNGNIITFMVIIVLFLWEIKAKRNDFTEYKISTVNIVTIILAFVAFWMPAKDGLINFNIKGLFLNEAGLTFCMIIPVIIASLLMFRKTINYTLLKIMSFIGIYIGLMNLMTWFIITPVFWWMGVLHLPLLINSLIGFIVAIKEEKWILQLKS